MILIREISLFLPWLCQMTICGCSYGHFFSATLAPFRLHSRRVQDWITSRVGTILDTLSTYRDSYTQTRQQYFKRFSKEQVRFSNRSCRSKNLGHIHSGLYRVAPATKNGPNFISYWGQDIQLLRITLVTTSRPLNPSNGGLQFRNLRISRPLTPTNGCLQYQKSHTSWTLTPPSLSLLQPKRVYRSKVMHFTAPFPTKGVNSVESYAPHVQLLQLNVSEFTQLTALTPTYC